MIFLQAKNDPNVVAQRFLDGLQHGQYKLGHETLKDLNATVTFLLAFVRNQMNTHAPIHALPTELLQLIFLHTLAPGPDAFLPFDARGASRADARAEARRTITLTHVCRRWRNVALDTGALWTRVSFDAHAPGTLSQSQPSSNSALPGAAAFLARSKAASLHVHAPFPASDLVHSALAPHASRIRSLALTLPAEERSLVPSGDASRALPFALPNLESLVLTTECDPFDDRRPLLDLHAPCALFAPSSSPTSSGSPGDGAEGWADSDSNSDSDLDSDSGTPRLRRLLLRNMCWVPRAPLAQLTHLFITEGTSVPLPALLRFLARCAASLEVLVLADVYVDVAGTHTPSPSPVSPHDTVALPKLKRCTLGIGGALLNMRRVLAHVVFPAHATVRVLGGRAFHALSHLAPFPDLAFARGCDTLSVDFAPHREYDCRRPGGRSPGAGAGGGVVIRASGPPISNDSENGGGRRPGLLLDFPTYRGSPAECTLMRGLVRALVPLERLVEVRYRVCAHQREPMHVLGGDDVALAALRAFRLVEVEGPCAHQAQVQAQGAAAAREALGDAVAREAFGDAVGKVLRRCPGLEEVEVWSGDAGLAARLAAGGRALSPARMVVHCDATRSEDVAAALSGRVGDVAVRRGSCAPSMEIPGTDIDWVDSPYEW